MTKSKYFSLFKRIDKSDPDLETVNGRLLSLEWLVCEVCRVVAAQCRSFPDSWPHVEKRTCKE